MTSPRPTRPPPRPAPPPTAALSRRASHRSRVRATGRRSHARWGWVAPQAAGGAAARRRPADLAAPYGERCLPHEWPRACAEDGGGHERDGRRAATPQRGAVRLAGGRGNHVCAAGTRLWAGGAASTVERRTCPCQACELAAWHRRGSRQPAMAAPGVEQRARLTHRQTLASLRAQVWRAARAAPCHGALQRAARCVATPKAAARH